MNTARVRVTEVLSPFIDYSQVPEERLSVATEKGTAVHKWIKNYLLGAWEPRPCEFRGYIDSFLAWKEIMLSQTIYVEQELICDCYGYMGHIDWVGKLKGGHLMLLDWKTPITESQVWKAQVAAYQHLVYTHSGLKGEKIRCGALVLDPSGKVASLREYTTEVARAFNGFVAALIAKRYFREGGTL